MRQRYYDLNDREGQVEARIDIADKTFLVARVVTGVRVTYANYLAEAGALLDDLGRFDEARASKEDKRRLAERTDEFCGRKSSALERCLQLLLKANGYAYDKDWWRDNASEADIQRFICVCLSKDVPEGEKKN